jgi:hypothetical protein
VQAELRKKERELKGQHKEISDLQIQVWHLLVNIGFIQCIQAFGFRLRSGFFFLIMALMGLVSILAA